MVIRVWDIFGTLNFSMVLTFHITVLPHKLQQVATFSAYYPIVPTAFQTQLVHSFLQLFPMHSQLCAFSMTGKWMHQQQLLQQKQQCWHRKFFIYAAARTHIGATKTYITTTIIPIIIIITGATAAHRRHQALSATNHEDVHYHYCHRSTWLHGVIALLLLLCLRCVR